MLFSPPWMHTINPVAFEVFGFGVRWYGLMYLVNLLIAGVIIYHLQRRALDKPMTRKTFEDILFGGFLWGIIGGRIGNFLFWETATLWQNPLEIFQVWNGGMSIHGGIIGTCVFLYYWSRKQKYSFLQLTDVAVLGLAVTLILGRFVNFINAELVGKPTDGSWGVIFPNVDKTPRHPTQLYESMKNVILSFVLFGVSKLQSTWQRPGTMSGVFLIGYGVQRLIIEFWKESFSSLVLGLNNSQWLCVMMMLLGIYILLARPKKPTIISA